MALSATLYHFEVRLADADRGVYETLALKVARHPSESDEYMVARVLAYCLEYTEGIAFSRGGLSDPDEPPLAVRDLTGVLRAWIDIGTPDAARIHRAAKAAPRVAVYTHKSLDLLLRALEGERIHRAKSLELYALPRDLVRELAAGVQRRMTLELSVSGGTLFLSSGEATLTGELVKQALPQ